MADAALTCAACHGPLCAPILTLPCGNSLHRACILAPPACAPPPLNRLLICPFAGCAWRAHPHPLTIAHAGTDTVLGDALAARNDVEVADALECALCLHLMADPVTLFPCGHSACRACLVATFTAPPPAQTCGAPPAVPTVPTCFLCRAPVLVPGGNACTAGAYYARVPANRALSTLIARVQPRRSADETDDSDANVPIFACTLVLPGMPCRLHVYEPRYRLMIRRVCTQRANRDFGMCAPREDGTVAVGDVGTLVQVQAVQWLADGRAIVETVGSAPFRILEKRCVDGYCVARIERVRDEPGEEVKLDDMVPVPETPCNSGGPCSTVRDAICGASRMLERFLGRLAGAQRAQFVEQFGTMPCDPRAFTWWVAGVLSVDAARRARLLTDASPKSRLATVLEWVRDVQRRCAAPVGAEAPSAAVCEAVGAYVPDEEVVESEEEEEEEEMASSPTRSSCASWCGSACGEEEGGCGASWCAWGGELDDEDVSDAMESGDDAEANHDDATRTSRASLSPAPAPGTAPSSTPRRSDRAASATPTPCSPRRTAPARPAAAAPAAAPAPPPPRSSEPAPAPGRCGGSGAGEDMCVIM
ncbi:hypothetical protein GGF31_003264 [Allomyces arbusculus]|nr:hypothetical protein GGF31_003264 [Allomyces arbusculus]